MYQQILVLTDSRAQKMFFCLGRYTPTAAVSVGPRLNTTDNKDQ